MNCRVTRHLVSLFGISTAFFVLSKDKKITINCIYQTIRS